MSTKISSSLTDAGAGFVSLIASELKLNARQVAATAQLLAEGGTVPFIARYRKEVTGSLDEVAITGIRDRMAQLGSLRRDAGRSSSRWRNAIC